MRLFIPSPVAHANVADTSGQRCLSSMPARSASSKAGTRGPVVDADPATIMAEEFQLPTKIPEIAVSTEDRARHVGQTGEMHASCARQHQSHVARRLSIARRP
jgi:hypothetical protein